MNDVHTLNELHIIFSSSENFAYPNQKAKWREAEPVLRSGIKEYVDNS
jgi:hypothetical protein